MLLYILWQCGLVLSTFINIPMSALAYMRFRLKDKEFYNYLKNRSLKDKILFNIKNAVRFFLPIYNIIYPNGEKSIDLIWSAFFLLKFRSHILLSLSLHYLVEILQNFSPRQYDGFFFFLWYSPSLSIII